MSKRISTAAYLAGVTTLAVSLPMMANARANEAVSTDAIKKPAEIQIDTTEDTS
ncbi:MAG: hypothetical protein AAGF55_12445 [Pseudomonadota bacterium]